MKIVLELCDRCGKDIDAYCWHLSCWIRRPIHHPDELGRLGNDQFHHAFQSSPKPRSDEKQP